jgi:hypothetical protein
MRLGWLPHVLWGVVLVVIIAVWWTTHDCFQLGTYDDDAKYVILARSLMERDVYGLVVGPAPPFTTGYPFGFPLALVPFLSWWPDAPAALTLLPLIATLLNVTLLYWGWPLLAGNPSRWWALGVTAWYGLTPLTLGHVGIVMADPLFASFVWAALILVECVVRRPSTARWDAPLLGVLCTAAVFTRMVGVALCAVVVLRLLAARLLMRRALGLVVGALMLLVPVVVFTPVAVHNLLPIKYLRTAQAPTPGKYQPGEQDLSIRVARGVYAYLTKSLRDAVLPIGGGDSERAFWARVGMGDLTPMTSAALAVLLLAGVVWADRSGRPAHSVMLFELIYVIVLLLWPFRTSRFLYPIQPFLVFHLLQGMQLLVRGCATLVTPNAAARLAHAVVVLTVVTLTAAFPLRFARAAVPSTRFAPDYRAGFAWVRAHTPADAVLLTEQWVAVAVHTNRPVVPLVDRSSVSELADTIARYRVAYVLVAPEAVWRLDGGRHYSRHTRETVIPLVEALQRAGRLQLVHADERELMRVYRVVTEGER